MIESIFIIPMILFTIGFISVQSEKGESIRIVRACTTANYDMCGDVLCEASYDDKIANTIKAYGYMVEQCLADPKGVDPSYYDPENQKRILGPTYPEIYPIQRQ